MVEFFGITLMVVAVVGGLAFGAYMLWSKGKLTRFEFLPKPLVKEKS